MAVGPRLLLPMLTASVSLHRLHITVRGCAGRNCGKYYISSFFAGAEDYRTSQILLVVSTSVRLFVKLSVVNPQLLVSIILQQIKT